MFITISAIYSAFVSFRIEDLKYTAYGWIFIITAALFNPIIPIYLNKKIWIVIDIIFSLIFIFLALTMKEEKK